MTRPHTTNQTQGGLQLVDRPLEPQIQLSRPEITVMGLKDLFQSCGDRLANTDHLNTRILEILKLAEGFSQSEACLLQL